MAVELQLESLIAAATAVGATIVETRLGWMLSIPRPVPAADDLVPLAELYGGAVFFDGADAEAVLRTWAVWSADLPAEATTSIAFVRLPPLPQLPPPLAGRFTVSVRFAWTGAAEQGPEVLGPMRAAATPVLDGVGPLPFAALGAIHMDPVDPMPSIEAHTLLSDLSEEAISALLALAGPAADCPQVIVEVRQLGGAIRHGAEAAFVQRDAAFCLFAVGLAIPPLRDAVTAHGQALVCTARAASSTRSRATACCRTSGPAATRPGTARSTGRRGWPGCARSCSPTTPGTCSRAAARCGP